MDAMQDGRRQGEKYYKDPTTCCEVCFKNRSVNWHYPHVPYPSENQNNWQYEQWPRVFNTDIKVHPRRCEDCR